MIPPIASRFVAGETPAEAVEHARRLEERGIKSICNRLGEHYSTMESAAEDRDAYCSLIEDIDSAGLGACISVKPSQLGLSVSEDCFRENFLTIIERAAEYGTFVWLDMEDHTTTDATLDAYAEHIREYENIGVCVQANLQRTPEDLRWLADLPGKVRLVKGAYDEPKEIAHHEKARINEAYRDCLGYMFERFDGGIAVGSHDPAMIQHATELYDTYGTEFEFQMLMGVREETQYDLAEEYEVWQYVPYGGRWLSYFSRRVMERRANFVFALRALIGHFFTLL